MPITVTPSTNFRDLETRQPGVAIPGSKLEDELVALRRALFQLSTQLDDVRRSDGKINAGAIDQNSFNPQLVNTLLQNAAAQVKTDADAARAAVQSALQVASLLNASAQTAQGAAAQAQADAALVTSAKAGAIQSITDERAAAADLLNAMVQEKAKLQADAQAVASTLALEQDWAAVCQAWAEYLGDGGSDTIPSSVIAWTGVTGSHWSARWWALKAQNAFGMLDSLYLGVSATPPTKTATGGAIPVGGIYYNSATQQPYVWTGAAWSAFWKPAKAGMSTLYYLGAAAQTVFPLATLDLYGGTFTLSQADPEGIEVYLNGSRLMLASGSVAGDFTVDYALSTITLKKPVTAGSLLTVDVLTPVSRLAPGSINVRLMKDFDLDPATGNPGYIDGVRTVFTMYRSDTNALVLTTSPEQVMISVDGIIQKPSIDYSTATSQITFVVPPPVGARVWGVWYSPAGTASSMGVQPPGPPYDQIDASYAWVPPTPATGTHAAVSGGMQWIDGRQSVRIVRDQAARMELRVPQDIETGSLVFQQDTGDIWVFEPATPVVLALPSVSGLGGSGAGTGTTGHSDINLTAGDPTFKAQVLALRNGDTVFFGGQYYQVTGTPTLGEESFPGGTAYAINPAPFVGQFSPVAGPSWNSYRAPATPGMARPATTTSTGTVAPTAAPGVATFSANSDWKLLYPGFPRDQILRALEYDPSRPNSMAWEDTRDQLETVGAEADLNNRLVLPLTHLKAGKLVYVQATGQLWECLVNGDAGTATNTSADWKPLGGAGVTFVGRIGNLPDPTTTTIPDGSMFMVNMDLLGNDYHRLYVFDAKGTNAAGVVGIYRTCSTKDFLKALRSDPDQGLDAEPGDIQVTLEAGHKELKAVDATSTWQTIYSEDQVKAWIAAGNLFQGTTQDRGHGTVGAVDLNNLPAQSALGITDSGHYYIYVGLAGHVIAANEIGGGVSNIDGAKLNVGDWILVANTGTPAAPVMRYTHVPGDLLAKSRGDNLYGLSPWAAGAYEIGSLVVYSGDIYKASQAVLATDIAPGVTPVAPAVNPWAKVNISGGVKTVAADTNLPAGAANGAVYLVLSSAQAGGKGALYMWDQAAAKWQALGGGGIPLALGGGKKIQNVGVPVGTVITYAGKTLPAGYLLCDGATFNATIYPQLNTVLGGNKTPDLRNQFVRGANTLANVDPATKHDWTTGRPKTAFTGTTNRLGDHTHTLQIKRIGGRSGGDVNNYNPGGSWVDATETTSSAGAHQHTVGIDGGGDLETAPAHVILAYIIKADDIGDTEV